MTVTLLATVATAAAKQTSLQQTFETHKHAILFVLAIGVLVIVGLKIVKHLAVIAALGVAGVLALLVLFPGLRSHLPGSSKQAKTQATQIDKRAKPCLAKDAKTNGGMSAKDLLAVARCIGDGKSKPKR